LTVQISAKPNCYDIKCKESCSDFNLFDPNDSIEVKTIVKLHSLFQVAGGLLVGHRGLGGEGEEKVEGEKGEEGEGERSHSLLLSSALIKARSNA